MRSEPDERGEILSNSPGEEPRDVEQEREEVAPSQNDPSAEPQSDQPLERVGTAGEDYSVLTVTQKKLIVTIASLASLFSPMATAIYC